MTFEFENFKIGFFSDTHDNIVDTKKVMSFFKDNNVNVVFHAGDLCAPFMIDVLDSFNIETHIVFGNVDDRFLTSKKAFESKNIVLHGDFFEANFFGKSFFMNHFPKIGFLAFDSKKYDFVVFGHTHKKFFKEENNKVIFNPGEILGRFGEKTFAIYDFNTDKLKFFSLKS